MGDLQRLPAKLTSVLSRLKKIPDSLMSKIGASTEDLQTFLPMTALFFTMAFINTIVNNLSMSLVITAPMGSAGVISFLTVYAALPMTIGATLLYTYASHFISPKKLFTITIGIFAACNLLFALCLFPNHEALHLPGVADAVAKILPSGLNGAVGMVRNWTFSAFYCLSEMWGDLGISLLFWGFANDVTTSKQAPIFYPLMGIGANVAQILGGCVVKAFSVGSAAAFSNNLQPLLLKLVGCMVVVMTLHHFIAYKKAKQQKEPSSEDSKSIKSADQKKTTQSNEAAKFKTTPQGMGSTSEKPAEKKRKYTGSVKGVRQRRMHQPQPRQIAYDLRKKSAVLRATFRPVDLGRIPIISVPELSSETESVNAKPVKVVVKKPVKVVQKKAKPTFMESIKSLGESPIVKSLGIMAIAQALSVTLIEFVWKTHCKVAYPTPAAFSGFMGDVATLVGVLTCAMMVLSPILFNRIGWKGVASITPVLMTVGGCAFFALCSAFHILGQLGMTQLAQQLLPMTVMGGAFLFILSRGTKFSLFKPSEEIIFINMKAEQRQKAKATVDVLGANLGKSGGSLLQQALLVLFGGHLTFITPVIFGVYMAMMNGWNRAVEKLSVFQAETDSKDSKTEEPKELKSVPLEELEDDVEMEMEEVGEEEEDNSSIKARELKSVPIKDLQEDLILNEDERLKCIPLDVDDLNKKVITVEDDDEKYTPLSQHSLPWDEDRESVSSSVVDFPLHKELDGYDCPVLDEVAT